LETATIKSPGWIVEDTEKDIKLVSVIGWHGEETMLGFDTILPKGCIEKVVILRRRWWL
tara:strand:+ start:2004 stop:2180 length:177 start_codon:yes stop_codon:yes gene_type:complete